MIIVIGGVVVVIIAVIVHPAAGGVIPDDVGHGTAGGLDGRVRCGIDGQSFGDKGLSGGGKIGEGIGVGDRDIIFIVDFVGGVVIQAGGELAALVPDHEEVEIIALELIDNFGLVFVINAGRGRGHVDVAVGLVADVVEDFIGLGEQPVVVFILVGFDGDTSNLLGVDEDIIDFILGGGKLAHEAVPGDFGSEIINEAGLFGPSIGGKIDVDFIFCFGFCELNRAGEELLAIEFDGGIQSGLINVDNLHGYSPSLTESFADLSCSMACLGVMDSPAAVRMTGISV